MKLANEINKRLRGYVTTSPYDIVLPNYYVGDHECDLFQLRKTGISIEYEIKISRADFFADFKKAKKTWGMSEPILKHDKLKTGDCEVNRFVFVVPKGLVTLDEVPSYCGLIYYDNGYFNYARSGKMLHKERPFLQPDKLWDICYHLHSRLVICKAKV